MYAWKSTFNIKTYDKEKNRKEQNVLGYSNIFQKTGGRI